jgi:hypothetical protein
MIITTLLLPLGHIPFRKYYESWDLRTSNGGSSLCGDEAFAWCFRFCSSGMQVAAKTQMKFKVLPFRVKI